MRILKKLLNPTLIKLVLLVGLSTLAASRIKAMLIAQVEENRAAQVAADSVRYQLTMIGINGPLQVLVDHVSHKEGFVCFRIIQINAMDCYKSPLMELAPINQDTL